MRPRQRRRRFGLAAFLSAQPISALAFRERARSYCVRTLCLGRLGSTVIRRTHVRKLKSKDTLIAHCREVMGQHAEGLSDEEIDELRRHAEAMARVLIEIFQANSSPAERP